MTPESGIQLDHLFTFEYTPILNLSLNRVAIKAFCKICSCDCRLNRRLMMLFRAPVFLLLAFMFPFISFPSSWTEHFQEEKSFSRLPCICGNIVFSLCNNFKQLSFTNCIICSDFIAQCCSQNSVNRHIWDKPFSPLP